MSQDGDEMDQNTPPPNHVAGTLFATIVTAFILALLAAPAWWVLRNVWAWALG